MKAFFTQPIGQLARQNCIGFIGCNLYLIGNGFGLYEGPEGINRIFNFAWAFTLLGIIIGGYYLICLLYTSPSPRDATLSRMPSSA